MKKIAIIMLSALLLNITPISAQCNHVHDEECGYNPITEEGCTHECENTCGDGIMPRGGGSGCGYCPF